MTRRHSAFRNRRDILAVTTVGVYVGPRIARRGGGRTRLSMCTSGRHKMEGEPRCKACRSEREKKKRAALSTVVPAPDADLLTDMPPVEVLDGAACSPATAELFDPISRPDQLKGNYQSTLKRVESAMDICYTCPVRLLCLADAYEHKRIGVFGGEYISPASHIKRAKSANQNTETREITI